jgi:hypothetical protein
LNKVAHLPFTLYFDNFLFAALTFWRLFRTYMTYNRVNQESSYAKEVISCSQFVFLENDSRHTDLQRGFLSPKFLGNCLRKTNMESRRMQINILIGVSYQVQGFIDNACFGWSKMATAKFKICEGCPDELGSQHIWLLLQLVLVMIYSVISVRGYSFFFNFIHFRKQTTLSHAGLHTREPT